MEETMNCFVGNNSIPINFEVYKVFEISERSIFDLRKLYRPS